jgi:hypothetical protein
MLLRPEEFSADEAAVDRGEGFVEVVAALTAEAEAAVLVEPGDLRLDVASTEFAPA